MRKASITTFATIMPLKETPYLLARRDFPLQEMLHCGQRKKQNCCEFNTCAKCHSRR
jgi:hypothetical protein